jgi:dTDP-4-dehydrorhamnose 3,5-epimerase
MQIKPLRLPRTYEVLLNPRQDDRGYFMRVFDNAIFKDFGLQTTWLQENESRSIRKHILRGLHFQLPPHTETKLVRVIHGTILDVFVDLRKDSETFGQWDSIELSAENHKMVYISQGFAHGYCSLTEETVVVYKVDSAYAPEFEGGLRWNDPTLNIQWPAQEPYLSAKDKALPLFSKFVSPF